MLIPSIDLLGGRIVQLVQGEKLRLAFDDFEYWIEKFSKFPLVQLIDLDAAMRQGDNSALVSTDCEATASPGWRRHRTPSSAPVRSWTQVPGASSLAPHFFPNQAPSTLTSPPTLPMPVGPDRIVAGIDTKNGRIAVKGWKAQVALTPDEAIPQLEPYAAAFLYTHVDGEGLMQGFPIETAARLRKLTDRQLIVAGGIRSQAGGRRARRARR